MARLTKTQDAALRATWQYSVTASGKSNLRIVGGADNMRMLSREEAWDTLKRMCVELSNHYTLINVRKGAGEPVYTARRRDGVWIGQDGRVFS
jgi:hypothetical protein